MEVKLLVYILIKILQQLKPTEEQIQKQKEEKVKLSKKNKERKYFSLIKTLNNFHKMYTQE